MNNNYPQGSLTVDNNGQVYILMYPPAPSGQSGSILTWTPTSSISKETAKKSSNYVDWSNVVYKRYEPSDISPTDVVGEKKLGEILRYPYEALTELTDYLKIDIRDYVPTKNLSGSLTANGSIRKNTKFESERGQTTGRALINSQVNEIISKTSPTGLSRKKLEMGKGTILLPMPSNIQDGNSVTYSEGNLDGLTSSVYGSIVGQRKPNVAANQNIKNPLNEVLSKLTTRAGDVAETLFSGSKGEAFKNIIVSDIFAQAANIPIGGSLTRDAIFARTTGQILNQNVELLFNGVTLRSFKFSFKMTPRNENEAQQIKLIINTFKQNMAPQLGGSGDVKDVPNLFLETPNVFELTYMQGGGPHPFLHSFKQCVLTDMSVNYTGEGVYSVYNDSTPVSMVLELGFKELEPIYDLDYDDSASIGVGY